MRAYVHEEVSYSCGAVIAVYDERMKSPLHDIKREGEAEINIMDMAIHSARTEDIPWMCELLAELFSLESDLTPDKEN